MGALLLDSTVSLRVSSGAIQPCSTARCGPGAYSPAARPRVTIAFAIFALAFLTRPLGTILFMAVDRRYGRSAKLTIALLLLGTSTVAIAFLPGYATIGAASAWLLALARIGQGIAWGGTWDGLPSLLSLNAPENRRGLYAMVPQLGAPIGLIVASTLFAFFVVNLSAEDFFGWGWRYPFFVAFAINVVALFARLRLVVTPEFARLFESGELQPTRVRETIKAEGRVVGIISVGDCLKFMVQAARGDAAKLQQLHDSGALTAG